MGGGDLQGFVQAFKSYRRLVGSFVEVHHNSHPKSVKMTDYPFVVIPCGHFACDQELLPMIAFERAVATGNRPGPTMYCEILSSPKNRSMSRLGLL